MFCMKYIYIERIYIEFAKLKIAVLFWSSAVKTVYILKCRDSKLNEIVNKYELSVYKMLALKFHLH